MYFGATVVNVLYTACPKSTEAKRTAICGRLFYKFRLSFYKAGTDSILLVSICFAFQCGMDGIFHTKIHVGLNRRAS